MVVKEALPEPVIEERWTFTLDKKKFGPTFKGDAKVIEQKLSQMEESDQGALQALNAELSQNGFVLPLHPSLSFKI